MTHARLKSSSIHSMAHDGTDLEVRFICGKCKGGTQPSFVPAGVPWKCQACNGAGHGKTYTFHGVPAEVHAKVLASKSVGKAFAELVKGKFEEKK